LSSKGREDSPSDLIDLPLRAERGDAFALPLAQAAEGRPVEPSAPRAAPASARVVATASDAAVVVLIVSAALLVAASRGRWPALAGAVWAAVFALYLSFFAIVAPLVFFGRTVGMALSGLAAAPSGGSKGLAIREASLRWVGTLLTGATLGIAVLFTRRNPEAPTPADALSGRPLMKTDSEPPAGP
jgi:hypothetical protein